VIDLKLSFAALLTFLCTPTSSAHDILTARSGASQVAPTVEAALFTVKPGTPQGNNLFSFVAQALIWTRPTLHLCFWNGETGQQREMLAIVSELTDHVPLSISGASAGIPNVCKPGTYATYDIRVSFAATASLLAPGDDPRSFFSVIGMASRNDVRKATVNLPFTPAHGPAQRRNKTLHEFCHALGCLHEHQRSVCSSELDRGKIQTVLGVTDEQFEAQFAEIPTSDAYYRPLELGTFDLDSVMLYTMHEWMFLNAATAKCYRSSEPTHLSQGDKNGLTYMYANANNSGRFVPQSIEGFAAHAGHLRTEAQKLARKAEQMRTQARQPHDGRPGPQWLPQQLEQQADEHDARAAELRAEAAEYELPRETIRLLREAMALQQGTIQLDRSRE